jgi:ATP-binding protein involved in chromosome partitioning
MSFFTAPTGERLEIFGHGGGREEAARQRVSFLGEVPLITEIREGGDKGIPVAALSPLSPAGGAFIQIAKVLVEKLP